MTHDESKRRRAKMAHDVDKGATPSDVAVAYGVRCALVYDACHEHGVTWNKIHPFAVLAKLQAGQSLRVAAGGLGITFQRVQQIRQLAIEHGIL